MAWLSGVRFNGARVRGARGYLAARLGLEGPGVILQLGIEVKTTFILISNHPH